MADLTINPDDIATALRKALAGFTPEVESQQVGRVPRWATASPG